MKNIVVLIMLLFACQIQAQTWNLLWSDEFNYTGLPDSTKWGNEVGFLRNNELQYYTSKRLENCKVENGNLLIIGKKENYNSANYTSASLTTDGKYSWTYGKIEARIKIPNGQGMWPAFWLLGQNIHQVNWPKCGEVDIMEHINSGNINYSTMHWDNNGHTSFGGNVACDMQQFHIYSIEWDEQSIIWLLDGIKYQEGTFSSNINSTEIFHRPFYIILNLAIGGNWPKSPDATTLFPDTMSVDYVRVYKKSTNSTSSISNEEFIKIYPNPVKDFLTIEIPLQEKKSILSICDLFGKELISRQVKDTKNQISMENLSKGFYILKYSNDLMKLNKKIILN